MTTKYLKLFIISTSISYFFLIFLVSDIGIISYISLKSKINQEKIEIESLKNEILELEIYKSDLENGDYVLDNALELGYINDNSKVNSKKNKPNFSYFSKKNNNLIEKKTIPLFKNWKRTYFFYISIIIGLVITLLFSVISIKMDKKRE